jgi:hypothetical protein
MHLAAKAPRRCRPVSSTLGSMKHASPMALHQLGALLDELREIGGLREPKTGTFYRGSSAFLHFHEDPAGLFADVKLDGREFTRFSLSQQIDRANLLKAVRCALDRPTMPRRSQSEV